MLVAGSHLSFQTTHIMAGERRASVVDESRLKVTLVFTKTGEHAVIDHVADADEEVLVVLGYKHEFKRFASPFILWWILLC